MTPKDELTHLASLLHAPEPLREETFDSAAAAAESVDAWLLRKD